MKSARFSFVVAVCACVLALAQGAAAQQPTDEADPASEARDERSADATEAEGSGEFADPEAVDEPAEGEPSQGIEEIIVTAQRRETVLQETPVAITVFDQAELDQRGVSDLQGLSFNVPNFHYGEVLGQARITIRGISTAGGDQAAAFHIDGIYQDSALVPSGLTFFDILRVETLRGPQGTLAGRNATGGAVFVVTQPPEFDFNLFGDIQFGNYHEIITRGVLNVPVVEDKVAARVSFIQDRHYGYTQNKFFSVRSRDVDDKNLIAVRSQIRVKPVDSVDWVLRNVYSRSKTNGGGLRIDGALPGPVPNPPPIGPQDYYATATPLPSDKREIFLDTAELTDTTLLGASSTFSWDVPTLGWLGDVTFTLMGGWQKRDQDSLADIDRTDASAFATTLQLITSQVDLYQEEWVVEANWTSQNTGDLPMSWVAGVFYLGTKGTLQTFFDAALPLTIGTPFGPLRGIGLLSPPTGGRGVPFEANSKDTSLAGFFDLSYDVLEELTLTGGVRYSVDWKQEDNMATQTDIFIPFGPLAGTRQCVVSANISDKDDKWDAVTGRGKLQWDYTDHNRVYASYSRGYKAGTIEHAVPSGCMARVPLNNADPEHINAYELGFKNEFFDNRLQANLTGFYYDYQDIQVSTLVEATVITQNAAAAEVAGVELELTGLPLDELLLTLNFAYLYSNFTDYENGCLVENALTCRPPDPMIPGSGFIDFTGNELPRAPRMSGTVTGQYTFDAGRFGHFIPFAQIYASDRLYFRASNLSTDLQKAYWLLDARLTWQSPSENLSWEFFVANALDKDIANTKLISTPILGSPQLVAYEPPRTFGTRVTLRW